MEKKAPFLKKRLFSLLFSFGGNVQPSEMRSPGGQAGGKNG
jgi:hypothetical protein